MRPADVDEARPSGARGHLFTEPEASPAESEAQPSLDVPQSSTPEGGSDHIPHIAEWAGPEYKAIKSTVVEARRTHMEHVQETRQYQAEAEREARQRAAELLMAAEKEAEKKAKEEKELQEEKKAAFLKSMDEERVKEFSDKFRNGEDEDVGKHTAKNGPTCCRCGPHFRYELDTVIWSHTGLCNFECQQLFQTQAEVISFAPKNEKCKPAFDTKLNRAEKKACRDDCRQIFKSSNVPEPPERQLCDGPGCNFPVLKAKQEEYIEESKGGWR